MRSPSCRFSPFGEHVFGLFVGAARGRKPSINCLYCDEAMPSWWKKRRRKPVAT